MIRPIWVLIAIGRALLFLAANYVGCTLSDYAGYRAGHKKGIRWVISRGQTVDIP